MLDYNYGNNLPDDFRARWRAMTEFYGKGKTFIPNRPQALLAKAIGELVPKGYRVFLNTSANAQGKTTGVHNILLNIIFPGYNIYNYAKYDDSKVDSETREFRRQVQEWELEKFREERAYSEKGESLWGDPFLEFPGGFFNYKLYNQYPHTWPKNIWYVSNADSLRYIHNELVNWAPPRSIFEKEWSESKDGKTYVSRVNFPEKGWNLYYKTIDQAPETFESANISIVIFDEPPLRNLYKAAVYRIRSGGFIVIPATPLFTAGWFVDDIVEKVKEGSVFHFHQTVHVWENCKETAGEWDLGEFGKQKIGNLEKSQLEFQLQETDDDEIEARGYGKFQHLVGLIFKSYDPKAIFRPLARRKIPRNYMYRFVLDPHDRKPPAASWYALDWHGRITKIREFPAVTDNCFGGKRFVDIKDSGRYTVKDFCRMFLEIEEQLQIPPHRIQDIIDPNFGNKKNSVTGLLIYEEYTKAMREVAKERNTRRHYNFITNVIDDLDVGHKVVKAMLKPLNTGDQPYLIDPSCVNTDLAYRRYKYKDQSQQNLEEMGLTDKIEQKWKDFIDNDRYCFMLKWKWRPAPQKDLNRWEDYGGSQKFNGSSRVKRPAGADGA